MNSPWNMTDEFKEALIDGTVTIEASGKRSSGGVTHVWVDYDCIVIDTDEMKIRFYQDELKLCENSISSFSVGDKLRLTSLHGKMRVDIS